MLPVSTDRAEQILKPNSVGLTKREFHAFFPSTNHPLKVTLMPFSGGVPRRASILHPTKRKERKLHHVTKYCFSPDIQDRYQARPLSHCVCARIRTNIRCTRRNLL